MSAVFVLGLVDALHCCLPRLPHTLETGVPLHERRDCDEDEGVWEEEVCDGAGEAEAKGDAGKEDEEYGEGAKEEEDEESGESVKVASLIRRISSFVGFFTLARAPTLDPGLGRG